MKEAIEPLSWEQLAKFAAKESDLINGPNNSYSLERLFGNPRSAIRLVLYRDHHAWCPYCQKIWLWLEWKKIPYQIKKVTMRCYGTKEEWYLKKVPSGMFPAIELDKNLITESDQILLTLEKVFGPLGMSMEHPQILDLRNLERELFRAWCIWLCSPCFFKEQASKREENFKELAKELDLRLSKTNSPWIDPSIQTGLKSSPGTADIIFIPYLERMNASLAYYKGLKIRKEFPNIDRWFKALEETDEYKGTQGDFHTHSHDLPPQMGGCWSENNLEQKEFAKLIDSGEGLGEQETTFKPSDKTAPTAIAVMRVLKHHERIKKANILQKNSFDQPLRAALTSMVFKKPSKPAKGSASGLRYLRDRISVPRDMPLLAARELRQALERTAELDGPDAGPDISTRNRFDQNPAEFNDSLS